MQLRTRITLAVLAALALLGAGLTAASYWSQSFVESRIRSVTAEGKGSLWREIIAGQLDGMKEAVSGLARDQLTREALLNGDKAALAENAMTTFNLLSASGVISRMQITDLDGEVLFSTPRDFSGKTRKQILARALSQGKILGGVERDDDGTLVAAIAFPITMRGKAIGIGLFARDLKDAIAKVKANDGSEVLILDADHKLLEATDAENLGKRSLPLPPLGEPGFDTLKLGNVVYAVIASPVTDLTARPLAHLVTVTDFTETYSKQRKVAIGAYVIIGVMLAAGLFGLYAYLGGAFRPLQSAMDALGEVAKGNLAVRAEDGAEGELCKLQRAVDSTATQLRGLIGGIHQVAASLEETGRETQQVAQGTDRTVEKLLSETAQVAAAVNEMAASVNEVAKHANLAAVAAKKADAEAKQGRDVVERTIAAVGVLEGEVDRSTGIIEQLEEKTSAIGAVVDVIRGIAEQTNLLALNAAIEAARAGEQGRGFAVVADEVRTLASRTQQSTQDIRSMIEGLQSGANEAVLSMHGSRQRAGELAERATEAGRSLTGITRAVETITDMNLHIASAAEQQSAVAGEINRSVENISLVAREGSESARQVAAASESLNQLVTRLQQDVRHFKV